jgi:hypothetical protein
MSEDQQLNWVEKRKKAENHFADSAPGLWRDLCAAMKDASRSFNKLYKGESEVTAINGHRFRVVILADGKKHEADIDFDDQSGKISTSYDADISERLTFHIKADHLSAFIVDNMGARLSVEEVSRSILTPSFFPDSASVYSSRGPLVFD